MTAAPRGSAAKEDINCVDYRGRLVRRPRRAAGLENVGCKAHARLNGPGDFHQQQLLVFVELFRRQMIDYGLISEDEINSLFAELEAHLADSATLVVSPLLVQAWGYKKR